MDTLDEEKDKHAEIKGGDALAVDDDGVLPPDELGEEEGGAKAGGDLENLDSWGLETDLEE